MERNKLAFDNHIDLTDESNTVSLSHLHNHGGNREVNIGDLRNEDVPISIDVSETSLVSQHDALRETASTNQDWFLPVTVFTDCTMSKDKRLSKAIRKFYKNQNDHISDCVQAYKDIISYSPFSTKFSDVSDIDGNQIDGKRNNEINFREQKMASKLAKLSLLCNIILLCCKAAAAGLSGSLTIISSLIDSAVDLASGTMVWATSRAVRKRDVFRYPQGRTRLEPVAVVVLSVIMAVASAQVIFASVQKIIALVSEKGISNSNGCVNILNITSSEQSQSPAYIVANLNLVVLSLVAFTIILKIVLYIICTHFGETPAVEALAQDHRNDVISNTVVIICNIITGLVWVYADPVGAIIIGLYIIYSWVTTCWEQVKVLTGYTADPPFLRLITLIAFNHHKRVKKVDTVRAFHHGTNYLVEVDIVLPEDMTVREAHDVAETLQQKLEHLENVERAFVHIDYEVSHNPYSEHKQV